MRRIVEQKIILRENRRRHVFRHFDDASIGSSFNREVFPHVNALLAYANSTKPVEIVKQTKNRFLYLFCHQESNNVGNIGVGKKSEIGKEKIVKRLRDGYLIEVGLVEEFETTPYFSVVVEKQKEKLVLVTTYPGKPSEPFPYSGQTAEERAQSVAFWRDRVLLMKEIM